MGIEDDTLLREAYKKIKSLTEPIAIIGMSCRFPGGGNTPEQFWEFIASGEDAIGEIPKDRWDSSLYYDKDPEAPGKMYVRNGGFISQNIHEFDAKCFNISPTEAIDMDPQQRMLLELSWEAFEHAQYDPTSMKGSKTGVFIGMANPEYCYMPNDKKHHDLSKYGAYWVTGTTNSIASGRIAYVFGLEGPAITLDTACSSSLVSTHMACESIRQGECDMALAGGILLMLTPCTIIGLCRTRALSPDGRCKTFDASADGYGRGEGGGMVLLKRLSAAIKDGDTILAIIPGSSINQDGASSGLTVPNGKAQEKVITDALQRAKLTSNDITYFETHGTGTALGDPIEMQSLGNVLGANRDKNNPLYLGAVKRNIGHTESAAGIAGVIKAILALQHKQIPPLKVNKLNPMIQLDKIPAIIPDQLIEWDAKGRTRYVGISSFALSGTNAHMILGEPPANYTPKKKADIPKHQFQRKSYWVELDKNPFQVVSELNALKGLLLPSDSDEHSFLYQISRQNTPEIVDTALELQGSIHIGLSQEMLLNAILDLEDITTYSIHDMSFLLPLMIASDEVRPIVIAMKKEGEKAYSFKIQSLKKGASQWAKHIQGHIKLGTPLLPSSTAESRFKKEAENMGDPTFDMESFYAMLDSRKMIITGSVRLVEKVWVNQNRLIAKIKLHTIGKEYSSPIDPGVYDACAQVLHALQPEGKMMVSKLEEMTVSRQVPFTELWCGMSFTGLKGKDTYAGTFGLQNEKGDVIIECPSFTMKQVTEESLELLKQALGQVEVNADTMNIVKSASPVERQKLITENVVAILAQILNMPKEEFNYSESISSYGMDSIMSISLKKEIASKLGIDIPIEEIISGPSIESLTKMILSWI